MKWLLKKMFASVGLEGPARKTLHTLRAAGWTPWKPLVPEEAFCTCVRNAVEKLQELERPHELGDYLEFGVSRGTSMACAYRTLQKSGLHEMRLIGFDFSRDFRRRRRVRVGGQVSTAHPCRQPAITSSGTM